MRCSSPSTTFSFSQGLWELNAPISCVFILEPEKAMECARFSILPFAIVSRRASVSFRISRLKLSMSRLLYHAARTTSRGGAENVVSDAFSEKWTRFAIGEIVDGKICPLAREKTFFLVFEGIRESLRFVLLMRSLMLLVVLKILMFI